MIIKDNVNHQDLHRALPFGIVSELEILVTVGNQGTESQAPGLPVSLLAEKLLMSVT